MPITILFDSGASHSFSTEQFVEKHDIPMSSMKTHLLVSSPNGEIKSTHVYPQVNLKIGGIDFQADLVVLTSSGLDVILGMDWLGECDGIILCAKKSVLLTSPQGDRIEVATTAQRRRKSESRLRKVGERAMPVGRTQCTRWTQNNTLSSSISPNLGTRFFLRWVDL
jgi:hypothetical protein